MRHFRALIYIADEVESGTIRTTRMLPRENVRLCNWYLDICFGDFGEPVVYDKTVSLA
jgi:hypothetical protein